MIVIPIVLAATYGLFGLIRPDNAPNEAVRASDIVIGFASEPRIQLFIVLPSWLIACCATILRSRAGRNLIRFGSWKASLYRSAVPLFIGWAIAAVIVVATWVVIAIGAAGVDNALPWALAVCGMSMLWSIVGLGVVFLLLSVTALANDSRALVVSIAAVVWVWAGLSNVGAFIGTDFDASLYLTFAAALTRPQAFGIGLSALMITAALAWLMANERDQTQSTGAVKPHYSSIAAGLAVCLVVIEAAFGDHQTSSVASVFSGVDGTVVQYLYGMLPLVLIASVGSSRFSEEWHHRLAARAIRCGSYGRLVRRTLALQSVHMLGYVAALLVTAVATRFAAQSSSFRAPAEAEAAFSAFPRLVLASVLIMVVGMLAVVAFSSDVAWAAASVVFLGIGFAPINPSPLFPITGWATVWSGPDAIIAASLLAMSIGVTVTVLMVASSSRKGVPNHGRY